jgi:hypothetical protein
MALLTFSLSLSFSVRNTDKITVCDVLHRVTSGTHLLVDFITTTNTESKHRQRQPIYAVFLSFLPGMIQRWNDSTVAPMICRRVNIIISAYGWLQSVQKGTSTSGGKTSNRGKLQQQENISYVNLQRTGDLQFFVHGSMTWLMLRACCTEMMRTNIKMQSARLSFFRRLFATWVIFLELLCNQNWESTKIFIHFYSLLRCMLVACSTLRWWSDINAARKSIVLLCLCPWNGL